jgi:regulator of protease activity HflC (stomatin/prohibitin superfamily)
MAKDLHSGERTQIERGIRETMATTLEGRGIVVENVLLKSIRLPAGLAEAVEQKLEAEQRAEQMRFVLERERQEAERKRVEAAGIRDAQQIIGEGLTPLVISFQSIQAFRELAQSANAKIILTDGRTPFLITPTEGAAVGGMSGGMSGGMPGNAPAASPARRTTDRTRP